MTAAARLRFWTRANVTYLVLHLLQVQSVVKMIPISKYQRAKETII